MATQAANPCKEAAAVVKEMAGDPIKLSNQCGLCSGVRPWNLSSSFIVRQPIHQAQPWLLLRRPLAHIGRERAAALVNSRSLDIRRSQVDAGCTMNL